MNKIKRFYVFMVLSVMTMPTAIFANYHSSSMDETNSSHRQWQMYNNDPDSQEKRNPSYNSNSEMIGDRAWETTSSRMNRQAAATSNARFNPNWNRSEQTEDRSRETTSNRMNRQAAAAANIRSNSTWIRNEQNRNDLDAATRKNTQR
jgi:hypothetical protein